MVGGSGWFVIQVLMYVIKVIEMHGTMNSDLKSSSKPHLKKTSQLSTREAQEQCEKESFIYNLLSFCRSSEQLNKYTLLWMRPVDFL